MTEHFRETASPTAGGGQLPGVFLFYDLSPIKVRRPVPWQGLPCSPAHKQERRRLPWQPQTSEGLTGVVRPANPRR